VSLRARLSVAALLATLVVANTAYTVIIPYIGSLQRGYHASELAIGSLFAIFAAARALLQPVGGWVVERIGVRPSALLAQGIVAAGIVAFAESPTLGALMASRVVWGAGEGLLTPVLYVAATRIARTYGISNSRMMGWFGSAAVTGLVFGPLVSGLAPHAGARTVLLGGAGAVVLTALLTHVALTISRPLQGAAAEPAPAGAAAEPVEAPTVVVRPWWHVALALGLVDLMTNASYSALEPTLPLYLADHGHGTQATSVVFGVGLTVFAVVSWLVGRRLERRPIVSVLDTGMAFCVVGIAIVSLGSSLGIVVTAFVTVMVGQPLLYVAARRGVTELQQAAALDGRSFGLFGAVSDVGYSVGPIIGSALFAAMGGGAFATLAALVAAAWLIARATSIGGTLRPRAAFARPRDAASTR
jgi:MFS family permease